MATGKVRNSSDELKKLQKLEKIRITVDEKIKKMERAYLQINQNIKLQNQQYQHGKSLKNEPQ